MSDTAPAWVTPVMRTGYAARAAVYTIVGGLALVAAWRGGSAEGTQDALAQLRGAPWGQVALWIIALGLVAYMVWRLIDAMYDLDNYGEDMKGWAARIGLVVTGIIHGAIGVSVASLALGGGSGGQGGTQSATAELMSLPYGPYLVGAVGVATIGAGIYYMRKGIAEKYKKFIRVTATTQRLDPLMKLGCVAEGVVVAIIGGSILYAAITTDPAQAGGIGQALDQVRSAAYGRVLLGIVALGLIGFAVENAVEAIYRIVPRRAGSDVMTLARRAKLKAEGKLRAATA
ncbi:DUF1206 domain-containing protein [Pseudoponticoccus marisrubri]|uniref:DUF1206 domain-containing protein n=1 Tax=Pseudoponticoccus marisrubri TaxID=1685382 RepID=A0A0W7WN81_9RHOB|nr:DUF1206 domain-containing protein [Pseudoponticoccus marisrubri]KUF12010.1 hypothetical protein AVJ23_05400 [Pseudoponticoccus marisrubri]